jgi:hypothetical protein
MPIEMTCACGRALVLRDELAGKTIRCPQCQAELTVPAAPPRPAPEPVLDVLPAAVAADPLAARAEEPAPTAPQPRRRIDLRDESLAPPKPSAAQSGTGFGSVNAGIAGGLLMMVVAVIWFVGALIFADTIFFYPPILFVVGLIAFIRGLAKGREGN